MKSLRYATFLSLLMGSVLTSNAMEITAEDLNFPPERPCEVLYRPNTNNTAPVPAPAVNNSDIVSETASQATEQSQQTQPNNDKK